MKENTISRIIEYFRDNEDLFNECIEELDNYNGYLGDYRVYEMEEIDELYRDADPSYLLERAFYGFDEDTWTTDADGEKTYGEFNPNRAYFYYSGYGNLVSTDYKDYSAHLDSYAIEAMHEDRPHIYTIENNEDLEALFDDLEEI